MRQRQIENRAGAPARPRIALALAVLAAAACGKGPAGPPGGAPAMPVEVVTLVERPVAQTTEFVGTVKSRRSTTVQPQVEGFVTRILVRSGDRVRPGTPLMLIDAGMQQAAAKSELRALADDVPAYVNQNGAAIVRPQRWNRYAYALNNPLRFTDA